MKPFLIAIAFLLLSGCKDNIVNHYIVIPAKHDTVGTKCDSIGDDDHEGGHHHHKKPHLKDREHD